MAAVHTFGHPSTGDLLVGLTDKEVINTIGRPDKINAGTYGMQHNDQWVYNNRRGTQIFAYLNNGILSAVQKSAALPTYKKPCPSPEQIKKMEWDLI